VREAVVSRCLMLMEDVWFFGKKGRDFGLFFKKSRIFEKKSTKIMTNGIGIEYFTDEAGNKSKVLISYEDWQRIEADLKEWTAYKARKSSLKTAFMEVKLMQQGKLPKEDMQTFLDEC